PKVSGKETFGFNFLIVAVHELGHALGLGHEPIGNEAPGTFWFIGTMNPRYPSGGPVGRENIIELWTDDRNGLRYLYPPSGPSQPPYRDIANAGYTASTLIGMAIPSIFWPSTAPPDSTITARAGIQNFGNTSELFVDFGFYLSTDDIIDGSDFFLGSLEFDLAFQDALDFDVDIDIPEDLAAGPYYLISRIDDLDEITEEFEDNNEVVYCEQLIIEQLPPAFQSLGQETTDEGVPYAGPTPVLAKPLNMAPITWTLDAGPPGMTIDASTGVLAWDDPVTSEFLYAITVRATNDAGTSTGLFFLGVQAPPAPTCPGDVDGDDATNLVDFTVLAMSFGASGLPHGNGESRSLGDLNDDGSVDLTDFTILALDFGCAP
ncbi:MAG: putative Ig domain-containing protein, partial [Planctomycetota bacterium]